MCDATFCFLALSLLAKHFILFFIISSLILKKEHGIKKEIRLVFSCPFRVLRWGYYYFPTVFHSFYFSLDSTFLYLFYIILKTKYNRTRFILSLYLSLFNELLFFYHYRLICSFFFFFFIYRRFVCGYPWCVSYPALPSGYRNIVVENSGL